MTSCEKRKGGKNFLFFLFLPRRSPSESASSFLALSSSADRFLFGHEYRVGLAVEACLTLSA